MRERVIGVLGGMSAASTAIYYTQLNALARARLGGLHGASLLIRSVDFAPIAAMQAADQWRRAGALLNEEALSLERGGADLLVLATNTMHCVANEIMHGVSIPLLHIGDATASAIVQDGLRRPGLLATSFTMEGSFYTDRLRAAGLEPILPAADDRAKAHQIIYDELCKDVVTNESKLAFEQIADRLVEQGADSLILGCTEICMLLNQSNVNCPVYDTTRVHCEAAITAALSAAPSKGHIPLPPSAPRHDARTRLLELGGSVHAERVGGTAIEPIFEAIAHVGEQRLTISVETNSQQVAEQVAAEKLLVSVFSVDY